MGKSYEEYRDQFLKEIRAPKPPVHMGKHTSKQTSEPEMVPVGVMLKRLEELRGAINRYMAAGLFAPPEWLDEHNRLVTEIREKREEKPRYFEPGEYNEWLEQNSLK